MTSLTKFKENLKNRLLELHWKEWSTLGISSHIEDTKNIIDLEALIVSSLFMGNYDKRLLSACLEWIKKNKEWIASSRIKQIGKHFSRVDNQLKKSLVHKAVLEYILILLKEKPSDKGKGCEKLSREDIPEDYKAIFLKLEDRDVTVGPVIQKYPLLQLYSRGIFGVNARADIFLYLLWERKGNSNRIAREIYFDQKIVYRILKKWVMAGFIGEEILKKETLYFLKSGQDLAGNIKSRGGYVNWCRVFYFFSRLLAFTETGPWADDIYLLSSLFRDIWEEAGVIGRYFNIMVPEANLYKGEEFFFPFASALLKILDKIDEGNK